ncbi:HD domain-containing protein 2 [Perkinsus chesapeaki]|uniref:HD domain-containing protein 2 n=1 Tax=Perkinsus chesapeaki TaxID=330153 RepID=A0A7J6LCG4_PERCH|nr:HD domain-containing protein 2 [Perkinsus chesapeaki]
MGAITSRFSRSSTASPTPEEEKVPSVAGIVDFMQFIGKLKSLRRTGWVRSGVPDPESDCDHMHRCAVLAMLSPDNKEGFDRQKTIRMALVHDLAEAVAGDITPYCGVSKEEKHKLEKDGLAKMLAYLREDPAGEGMAQEIEDLWNEFEAGTTQEVFWPAIYAKDIDKFDMLLQAYEYEKAYDGLVMPTFYESTKGIFKTPLFRAMDAELTWLFIPLTTQVRYRRERLFDERDQDPTVEHLPYSTEKAAEENDEELGIEEKEGAPPAKKARTDSLKAGKDVVLSSSSSTTEDSSEVVKSIVASVEVETTENEESADGAKENSLLTTEIEVAE